MDNGYGMPENALKSIMMRGWNIDRAYLDKTWSKECVPLRKAWPELSDEAPVIIVWVKIVYYDVGYYSINFIRVIIK